MEVLGEVMEVKEVLAEESPSFRYVTGAVCVIIMRAAVGAGATFRPAPLCGRTQDQIMPPPP